MRPIEPVAVVIPTLNERERIGRLLSELGDGGWQEIAVVDGGSLDGTVETVRRRAQVRLLHAPACRGAQINVGVAATRAPFIVVLHADTRLPAAAAQLIACHLSKSAIVGGCFRLRFDVRSPLLDLYALLSRLETRFTTFGDQAFFFRRSAFETVGGSPEWPLLEDVELRRRLRQIGRFEKLAATIVTSSRRFEQHGRLRTQLLNGSILLAHQLGWPVSSLAEVYHRGGWLRSAARRERC